MDILQELPKKRERELLKESETAKIIKQTETKIFTQIGEYSAGIKNEQIPAITKKLKKKTTARCGKFSKSQSYIGNSLPNAQAWYSTIFIRQTYKQYQQG